MNCPNCNAQNSPRALFCYNCGKPLPLVCPTCGEVSKPGAKFCSHCGTRLREALKIVTPHDVSDHSNSDSTVSDTQFPAIHTSIYERRQVTILFADITGYSTLSEYLDPEEVLDIMHAAYPCLIDPVKERGGTIVQVMGDGLLAFFGAPLAHEDDPERAIRAGLDIQRCIQTLALHLNTERGLIDFNVRIGIHAGLVVVGEMSPEKQLEYTALGDAVNLAARLQELAQPGTVLVSHEVFRHVRGLFDAKIQPPMAVRGRQQTVQTYVITNAKQQSLYIRTRGVEGVDTHMVGREPEMLALQNIYQETIVSGDAWLVLATGEPGIGKSRLLDEFVNWVDLQPEEVWLFRGRATAVTQNSPFALLRDVFAYRFEILDSDSTAEALSKFRLGMANQLEPDQADLVGQLVGFNFSTSPAVSRLLGSPSFKQVAIIYLINYIRQLAASPTLILLEDLHWADDSSLDLIVQLMDEIRQEGHAHMMIVCAARPTLFERRPNWAEGISGVTRIGLRPLSQRSSRNLVEDILKSAGHIPTPLVDRIVDETEGSPFFIEELIKMLIEEKVIDTGSETWHIYPKRLAKMHVPPTLAGILQARLDSLPASERRALQRAAVVGRIFWDRSIAALTDDQSEAFHIPDRLASLRERELIYRRERSMFAGAEEYLFKHSLLQEATYETVLLKQRRILHGQIGAWIEANAGERLEEYLVIVAGHYAAADQPKRAADWYVLAGERAARQGATPEATDLFTCALELYPKNELAGRWRALAGRDGAYGTMGEREAREADDTALLALAEEMNDDHFLSEAYFRLGFHQYTLGNNERSIEYYDRGLECARRIDDTVQEAVILPVKLISLTRLGDLKMAETLVEPTLRLAFSTTNLEIQTRALNNVAYYYSVIGDIARAAQLVQQGVELNQEQGNLFGEVVGLANLGYNYLLLGRYEEGRQVLEKTVEGSRKISAQQFLAYSLLNLAMAHWRLGNLEAAEQKIQDSAASLQSMGDEMGLAFNRFYHALIRESAHDYVAAATCYETARNDFERLHNLPQKYEAIAGLARLEKEDGDQQEARDLALQIFEYLTENGPQGMELPFLVYLTCAEIFYSDEDLEHLAYIMEKGQDELRTRAGQISDIAWRQTFMDVVPEHRLLKNFKPDHKINS